MMKKSDVYKGKLGFDGQFSNALSRATPIVIDTFEDHGHDVHTFAARSTSAVQMDLDQYAVELRYRPQLKRGWQAQQSQGDMLELRIAPLFPDVCDQEITEMLLAAVLHNLVSELEIASVKWLDTKVMLTRNQFLSAFDPLDFEAFAIPQDARVPEPFGSGDLDILDPAEEDAFCLWDHDSTIGLLDHPFETKTDAQTTITAIAAHDTAIEAGHSLRPTRTTRPRGRSVFAPVDDTARALETQCDEILMANYVELHDDAHAEDLPTQLTSADLTQGNSIVWSLLSMPFTKASGALRALRESELRHSFQILLLTAVGLYLHSAGMVRAAIDLLH